MNSFALLINTCFFSGKIPLAPGTFGSIFALIIWCLVPSFSAQSIIILLIFISVLSYYTISITLNHTDEKDPQYIVIDEAIGMWIALLAVYPDDFFSLFLAFTLFRLLDILKPSIIYRVQSLPGASGILLDDIIAGLITELDPDNIPSNLAGGLILLPGFLAALIKPAELQYFHEERCGDWWKAMISEPIMPRTTILEIIAIIIAPFITSLLVLNGTLPDDKIILLICSITILLVMYANNAIYSLAENMPRKNSTFIPLLTLILIWPYLITSNMLLTEEFNNSINEIILVIVIPSIIYLVVPTLSKK